jgi:hypothetical protein
MSKKYKTTTRSIFVVELEGALLEERKFYSTKGGHAFPKTSWQIFSSMKKRVGSWKNFHLMLYTQ